MWFMKSVDLINHSKFLLWWQLDGSDMIRSFLSLKRVWLAGLHSLYNSVELHSKFQWIHEQSVNHISLSRPEVNPPTWISLFGTNMQIQNDVYLQSLLCFIRQNHGQRRHVQKTYLATFLAFLPQPCTYCLGTLWEASCISSKKQQTSPKMLIYRLSVRRY